MKKFTVFQSMQLSILKKLEALPPEKFAPVFNTLNKLVTHYPIQLAATVNTQTSDNLILTVSDGSDSITISQTGRVRLYRNRIEKRLRQLEKIYWADEIDFTESDIVIDCGANIGELTKALQNKYNVSAISIEPEPKEVAALRKNTTPEKTHIYEELLWNEETVITFYHHNESADSSVFLSEGGEATERNAVRLDELVVNDSFFKARKNIKLLKVEAEGAEPEIVEGATGVLPYTEYVVVDCGPERANSKEKNTVIPVLHTLLQHNFTPIKFSHDRLTMLYKNNNLKAYE